MIRVTFNGSEEDFLALHFKVQVKPHHWDCMSLPFNICTLVKSKYLYVNGTI